MGLVPGAGLQLDFGEIPAYRVSLLMTPARQSINLKMLAMSSGSFEIKKAIEVQLVAIRAIHNDIQL